MVADAVIESPYAGREILRTGAAVGIEEEKGLAHGLEPAPGKGPVSDFIMLVGGRHIVDILAVVLAADGFPHTDKLPGVAVDHNIVISSISRNKNGTFFVGQAKGGGK